MARPDLRGMAMIEIGKTFEYRGACYEAIAFGAAHRKGWVLARLHRGDWIGYADYWIPLTHCH